MAEPIRRHEGRDEELVVELSVHATSPDRTVFAEPGNTDGWISTDYTVELER